MDDAQHREDQFLILDGALSAVAGLTLLENSEVDLSGSLATRSSCLV